MARRLFGIGTDLCHVPRIRRVYERYGQRFVLRMCHPEEVAELRAIVARGTVLGPGHAGAEGARDGSGATAADAVGAGGGQGDGPGVTSASVTPEATAAAVRFLASRWAAKEAAYKALGRWRVKFPDLQVLRASSNGPPSLRLHGGARQIAEDHDIEAAHLSLSHDGDYATAYVALEARA